MPSPSGTLLRTKSTAWALLGKAIVALKWLPSPVGGVIFSGPKLFLCVHLLKPPCAEVGEAAVSSAPVMVWTAFIAAGKRLCGTSHVDV